MLAPRWGSRKGKGFAVVVGIDGGEVVEVVEDSRAGAGTATVKEVRDRRDVRVMMVCRENMMAMGLLLVWF